MILSLTPEQLALLEQELAGEGRIVLDTAASSSLSAGNGSDFVLGLAGNDKVYGQDGNDLLWGHEGGDALYGGAGDDVLVGGAGDDTLQGGAGSDTYLFSRGDGWDTIDNGDASAGRWDVLQFLDGIAPGDVYARRNAYNALYLYILGSKEGITVGDFYASDGRALNEIRFADGTSWSPEQIKALVLASSDEDDTLYGYASDDDLIGGLGKDVLYGNAGNDRLDGGEGNDRLFGGDGNDYLEGGSGNDTLEGGNGDDVLHAGTGGGSLAGGAGSDTYLFGHGDGLVTVKNNDSSQGRRDVLQFLKGVSASEVTIERVNKDLHLYLEERSDCIRIADYFRGASYRLDAIRFDDVIDWSHEYIQDRLSAASGEAATAPPSYSPTTWSVEHDLNALVSAMAGVASASDTGNPVVQSVQQIHPNWASLAA
jgi:Ca2+-binding RTX toxin-like protein